MYDDERRIRLLVGVVGAVALLLGAEALLSGRWASPVASATLVFGVLAVGAALRVGPGTAR